MSSDLSDLNSSSDSELDRRPRKHKSKKKRTSKNQPKLRKLVEDDDDFKRSDLSESSDYDSGSNRSDYFTSSSDNDDLKPVSFLNIKNYY